METFKQHLLKTLEELCLDTDIEIITSKIVKQNDTSLTAICLKPTDSTIGTNYYVEELFKRYESLGYVSANYPRFCSNVLTTKIVDSIIDNKPYRSKNKSSIGQVSTEVYEEINKNARPLTEEEMKEWEL